MSSFNCEYDSEGNYRCCNNSKLRYFDAKTKGWVYPFDRTPLGAAMNPTNYNSMDYAKNFSIKTLDLKEDFNESFYEEGRKFSNDENPDTNPWYGNFYGGEIPLRQCINDPSKAQEACSKLGKYWKVLRTYNGLCTSGVRVDCVREYPNFQNKHDLALIKNGTRILYEPKARGNGLNLV